MIIGLTGYAGVGKDTVADILVERHGFTKVSFADPLREMAAAINPIIDVYSVHPNLGGGVQFTRYNELVEMYGYTRAKEQFPEIRQFLQRLGTDAVRNVLGQDTWADKWYETVKSVPGNVVAADVRFENEAFAVKSAPGGVIVRVKRPCFGPVNDHVSEQGKFMSDRILLNDGNVEDLYAEIAQLLRWL